MVFSILGLFTDQCTMGISIIQAQRLTVSDIDYQGHPVIHSLQSLSLPTSESGANNKTCDKV